MLRLEEQIERIADVAFGQTSPVSWTGRRSKRIRRITGARGRWSRHR